MKRIGLILLGICCCLLISGFNKNSGNNFFSVIDAKNGLSQNRINAIIQDSRGFIWFGTPDKLNRYDGTSIKTFDCTDSIGQKRDNYIAVLAEDNHHNLWIGTGIGVFVYDPGSNIFTYFNKTTADGTKIEAWISDIQSDKDNNIWITSPGQGVFRYNTLDGSLHHYILSEDYYQNRDFAAQCICVENSGTVWIGSRKEGLFSYNNISDTFHQHTGNSGTDSLIGYNIFKLCEFGKYIVIGIHDGILKLFNKQTKELEDGYIPNNQFDVIRTIQSYNNKELWVGTESGLYIINDVERTTTHIEQDLMNNNSLSDNKISCIYQDKEDGIWIGTFFGGACYLPTRLAGFETYIPLSHNSSISSKRIKGICEDRNGNIWVGTEDAGLNILNPYTNEFKQVKTGSSNITGFFVDKDKTWIGYFQPGFDIINLSGNRLSHYTGEQSGIRDESIYSFIRDKKETMWIGTLFSLYYSSKNETKFKEIEMMQNNFIFDILEDKEGFIWIATLGQGVFRYNSDSGELKHYYFHQNDSNSLMSNAVSSITEDSRGQLWFSTDGGGISVFNKKEDCFTSYGIQNGLPSNTTYKILEDDNRNLWFGTTKGLVKFNPESGNIRIFTVDDGLPGNSFNYKSALKSSSGKFYFGSLEGLVAFDPCHINTNDYIPPVFITKITIRDKGIDIFSDPSPITLKHNQSSIGLEFAVLSYTAPSANKCAYKMEGIDDEWIYTEKNRHNASYPKLSPGNYTFRVKGCNNNGIWNEKETTIKIKVLSPWWLSTPAIIVYICIILGVIYFWIHWYKQKQKRRYREKQYLFETQKEKELYRSKVDFFTTIAHEIRTPLTLINAPLESLLNRNIEDKGIRKELSTMEQNTAQLVQLINQLLDFRKVDSNRFSVNYSKININELLRNAKEQFDFSIRQKKKVFTLFMPDKPIIAIADKDGLMKIINNLFSNAVKYADSYIEVELKQEPETFTIQVRNDGETIPAELKEKIFEPFFQLKKDANTPSSSGIGLSIARSLAELHNGSLDIDTNNKCTVFVLTIPLEQPDFSEEGQSDYIIEDNELKEDKKQVYSILLVEDNIEILSFIAEKLEDIFSVKKAGNGIEALEVLQSHHIDLIISDVMMDHMDGLELCRQVKENIEYSHIPVVLLTAKSDLNSKIQGLEAGADAYIEKPFSFNYLITQLTTLLSNRLRERNAFMHKPFLPVQKIGLNKADELFLNKIIGLIHQNITDYNFGVEKLADMLSMSRSSLHRKIKAVSDLSPTDFIRLIRLKKAAELIQTGEHRIGDIPFLIGINSFSYFSKVFKEQFGLTPKEFEKQGKKSD